MNLSLKKADESNIHSLHAILVACGKKMHDELDLQHWHPFMDIDTFKQSIFNKELYAVYQNQSVIATFNLSTTPHDYYHIGLWSKPGFRALYLGQLATVPGLQRKGFGKWCLQQIEKIALEKDCQTVRFDIVAKHPWLKTFYEEMGYKPCAIVKPQQWDLLCFEKHLI